ARAGRPDRRPLRRRASTPLQLPPVTTEHCNKTASWSSTTHSAVSSIGTTSPATCAIAVTLRRVGGRESAPATDNVPVGDRFRARLRGSGSASCPDYIRSLWLGSMCRNSDTPTRATLTQSYPDRDRSLRPPQEQQRPNSPSDCGTRPVRSSSRRSSSDAATLLRRRSSADQRTARTRDKQRRLGPGTVDGGQRDR